MNREEFATISHPARLKLSVMRAFVAEVTGNMAGIATSIVESKIILSVYFFVDPSERDREHVEMASTEILADYPELFSLESSCRLISELEDLQMPWVLLRAEVKR